MRLVVALPRQVLRQQRRARQEGQLVASWLENVVPPDPLATPDQCLAALAASSTSGAQPSSSSPVEYVIIVSDAALYLTEPTGRMRSRILLKDVCGAKVLTIPPAAATTSDTSVVAGPTFRPHQQQHQQQQLQSHAKCGLQILHWVDVDLVGLRSTTGGVLIADSRTSSSQHTNISDAGEDEETYEDTINEDGTGGRNVQQQQQQRVVRTTLIECRYARDIHSRIVQSGCMLLPLPSHDVMRHAHNSIPTTNSPTATTIMAHNNNSSRGNILGGPSESLVGYDGGLVRTPRSVGGGPSVIPGGVLRPFGKTSLDACTQTDKAAAVSSPQHHSRNNRHQLAPAAAAASSFSSDAEMMMDDDDVSREPSTVAAQVLRARVASLEDAVAQRTTQVQLLQQRCSLLQREVVLLATGGGDQYRHHQQQDFSSGGAGGGSGGQYQHRDPSPAAGGGYQSRAGAAGGGDRRRRGGSVSSAFPPPTATLAAAASAAAAALRPSDGDDDIDAASSAHRVTTSPATTNAAAALVSSEVMNLRLYVQLLEEQVEALRSRIADDSTTQIGGGEGGGADYFESQALGGGGSEVVNGGSAAAGGVSPSSDQQPLPPTQSAAVIASLKRATFDLRRLLRDATRKNSRLERDLRNLSNATASAMSEFSQAVTRAVDEAISMHERQQANNVAQQSHQPQTSASLGVAPPPLTSGVESIVRRALDTLFSLEERTHQEAAVRCADLSAANAALLLELRDRERQIEDILRAPSSALSATTATPNLHVTAAAPALNTTATSVQSNARHGLEALQRSVQRQVTDLRMLRDKVADELDDLLGRFASSSSTATSLGGGGPSGTTTTAEAATIAKLVARVRTLEKLSHVPLLVDRVATLEVAAVGAESAKARLAAADVEMSALTRAAAASEAKASRATEAEQQARTKVATLQIDLEAAYRRIDELEAAAAAATQEHAQEIADARRQVRYHQTRVKELLERIRTYNDARAATPGGTAVAQGASTASSLARGAADDIVEGTGGGGDVFVAAAAPPVAASTARGVAVANSSDRGHHHQPNSAIAAPSSKASFGDKQAAGTPVMPPFTLLFSKSGNNAAASESAQAKALKTGGGSSSGVAQSARGGVVGSQQRATSASASASHNTISTPTSTTTGRPIGGITGLVGGGLAMSERQRKAVVAAAAVGGGSKNPAPTTRPSADTSPGLVARAAGVAGISGGITASLAAVITRRKQEAAAAAAGNGGLGATTGGVGDRGSPRSPTPVAGHVPYHARGTMAAHDSDLNSPGHSFSTASTPQNMTSRSPVPVTADRRPNHHDDYPRTPAADAAMSPAVAASNAAKRMMTAAAATSPGGGSITTVSASPSPRFSFRPFDESDSREKAGATSPTTTPAVASAGRGRGGRIGAGGGGGGAPTTTSLGRRAEAADDHDDTRSVYLGSLSPMTPQQHQQQTPNSTGVDAAATFIDWDDLHVGGRVSLSQSKQNSAPRARAGVAGAHAAQSPPQPPPPSAAPQPRATVAGAVNTDLAPSALKLRQPAPTSTTTMTATEAAVAAARARFEMLRARADAVGAQV